MGKGKKKVGFLNARRNPDKKVWETWGLVGHSNDGIKISQQNGGRGGKKGRGGETKGQSEPNLVPTFQKIWGKG